MNDWLNFPPKFAMRILIVEDDPAIVESLRFLFDGFSYVVDAVPDGESALEGVDTFEYDLVILDISLPGLDGISVCQQLRAKDLQQPILLLTGQSDFQEAIAVNAGATGCMVKPFDVTELIVWVQGLLQ